MHCAEGNLLKPQVMSESSEIKLSPNSVIEKISTLSFADVTSIVAEVLEGRSWIYGPRDVRIDTEPYVDLIKACREENVATQRRMSAALDTLLTQESPKNRVLSEPAMVNLLRVLQDSGKDNIKTIVVAINSQTWLPENPDFHALLLKAATALDYCLPVEIWREQLKALGPTYGALVFSGLLLHGTDVAFKEFPHLASTQESACRIAMLLPEVVAENGEDVVRRHLQSAIPKCDAGIQAIFHQLSSSLPILRVIPTRTGFGSVEIVDAKATIGADFYGKVVALLVDESVEDRREAFFANCRIDDDPELESLIVRNLAATRQNSQEAKFSPSQSKRLYKNDCPGSTTA